METTNQIVAYRSRMAMEIDNFWWGVITDNPWLITVGMAVIGLLMLSLVVVDVAAFVRKNRRK